MYTSLLESTLVSLSERSGFLLFQHLLHICLESTREILFAPSRFPPQAPSTFRFCSRTITTPSACAHPQPTTIEEEKINILASKRQLSQHPITPHPTLRRIIKTYALDISLFVTPTAASASPIPCATSFQVCRPLAEKKNPLSPLGNSSPATIFATISS